LSFPLMAAVQLMCARLGMVTGCGLASVIRTRYPRWVLWFACGLVIIANVFSIGADLGGIADAMQMITGIPATFESNMPVMAREGPHAAAEFHCNRG
jgi:Mn2+/Fe2+ NRAMP family transporter